MTFVIDTWCIYLNKKPRAFARVHCYRPGEERAPYLNRFARYPRNFGANFGGMEDTVIARGRLNR